MKHRTIEHRKHLSKALRKGYASGRLKTWNTGIKGIHLSPRTEFKKGCRSYIRTSLHRIKMSNSVPSGIKHYRWKGGVKSRSKHSDDMRLKIWREKVFQRDNWICQNCLQRGRKLQAHHKKGWVDYPKFRYLLSNGITYCVQCHRNVHKKI